MSKFEFWSKEIFIFNVNNFYRIIFDEKKFEKGGKKKVYKVIESLLYYSYQLLSNLGLNHLWGYIIFFKEVGQKILEK